MRCEVVPLRVQEAARSGGDKLPKITFVTIARRTTIDQIIQLIAPASTKYLSKKIRVWSRNAIC
jgi:hypothetical protein